MNDTIQSPNDDEEQVAEVLWRASDDNDDPDLTWENNYARDEWLRMAAALRDAGLLRDAGALADGLDEAADNMPLNRPGQPYEHAAGWLHRRADAFRAALAGDEDPCV